MFFFGLINDLGKRNRMRTAIKMVLLIKKGVDELNEVNNPAHMGASIFAIDCID